MLQKQRKYDKVKILNSNFAKSSKILFNICSVFSQTLHEKTLRLVLINIR
jgi:hypothetical protein